MIICKEMQKLRAALDKMGVGFTDESEEWEMFDYDSGFAKQPIKQGICRTHFDFNGVYYSVINGFCTYGGYDWNEFENKGLLEIMLPNGEVEGYLTAHEIIEILKEAKK